MFQAKATEPRAELPTPVTDTVLTFLALSVYPAQECSYILEWRNVRRPTRIDDEDRPLRVGQRTEVEAAKGLGHPGDSGGNRALLSGDNNRSMQKQVGRNRVDIVEQRIQCRVTEHQRSEQLWAPVSIKSVEIVDVEPALGEVA